MRIGKILIGTLVAGSCLFFLGWIIYGLLLAGFMSDNCESNNARPMKEMIWWALIASNLVWGLLLAILLDWMGNLTISSGAKVGAVLGLLKTFGFDLHMHATTSLYHSYTVIIVDALGFTIMFATTGLLTAWVMNKIGKPEAEPQI